MEKRDDKGWRRRMRIRFREENEEGLEEKEMVGVDRAWKEDRWRKERMKAAGFRKEIEEMLEEEKVLKSR